MKFLAESDRLIVTFEGIEKFFALKGKLVIPRAQIVDLQWLPELTFTERIWRLGGTDIPRSLWAGRFTGGGKRYFMYLRKPPVFTWTRSAMPLQDTLTISLQDNFYQRVLLTCDPDIGASLLNWWKTGV